MLVILPFEKDFYRKWNYEVEYVGHPLVDVTDSFKLQPTSSSRPQTQKADSANPDPGTRPVIALLPGSRKQEILKKLPIMLEVSRHFPDYQPIVAKAPGLEDEFYNAVTQRNTPMYLSSSTRPTAYYRRPGPPASPRERPPSRPPCSAYRRSSAIKAMARPSRSQKAGEGQIYLPRQSDHGQRDSEGIDPG